MLEARGMSAWGAVVIGRNEGERLKRCLRSLGGAGAAAGAPVVYVDSGSSDGSPEAARALGVEVVALDLSTPFTAARARNTGLAALRGLAPGLELVQFVDGDCEIVEGWTARALAFMSEHPKAAAVAGRLRERHPEASVYNRLCDLEWDTPHGEALSVGGIAMFRVDALEQVGGFNPALIAGEEPELCLRLRERGWSITRVPDEMARHDAAMTRFSQWWKRSVRAGHTYAQSLAMHGRTRAPHQLRRVLSALAYGLVGPGMIVLGAAALAASGHAAWAACVVGLAAGWWALTGARLWAGRRRRGRSSGDAALFAAFCLLGKAPESIGVLRYAVGALRGRPGGLIEYK